MTIDEDADIGEYYHEDDKVEYVQTTHYFQCERICARNDGKETGLKCCSGLRIELHQLHPHLAHSQVLIIAIIIFTNRPINFYFVKPSPILIDIILLPSHLSCKPRV